MRTTIGATTERRFACPGCGQHYAVDWSWGERPVVCLRCARKFQPGALPPAASDPTIPSQITTLAEAPVAGAAAALTIRPARKRVRVRIIGSNDGGAAPNDGGAAPHEIPGQQVYVVGLGLFTPLILTPAVGLGFLTWIFAVVVCPMVAKEVSTKLFEHVYEHGEGSAIRSYIVSAFLGFAACGVLCWAALRAINRDDGAGLVLGIPMGIATVSLVVGFVVWGLLASPWWSAVSKPRRRSML